MKKGFTLVELLAVLVIIGILLTISAIAVIPIKEQSANSLYNEQVKRIEGAAKLWAMDNSGLLYGKESYALTLDSLIESDFLKEDQIIDPRSNELMSGCVIITYGNQNYSYNYNEDCD